MEYTHDVRRLASALDRRQRLLVLRQVSRRRLEQARELAALRAVVGRTFFGAGDWVKFYPDRIDSEVYDREHAELNAHIESAWNAYKAYREAVKNRLRV